jgi:hypothetical protein
LLAKPGLQWIFLSWYGWNTVGYNVRGTSPALLKETWDYCTLKMKKKLQTSTSAASLNLTPFSLLDMQIFPIHMKGSAGSLVTLVSWLGSWVVSYAFNFLLLWSSYGKYYIHLQRRKWTF